MLSGPRGRAKMLFQEFSPLSDEDTQSRDCCHKDKHAGNCGGQRNKAGCNEQGEQHDADNALSSGLLSSFRDGHVIVNGHDLGRSKRCLSEPREPVGGRGRRARFVCACRSVGAKALASARSHRAGECLYVRLDIARLLIPPLGFLFQCAKNDFIEPHVDLHLLRGRGKAAHGKLAGEHLIEDDAQGINVGTMVHL